MERKFISFTNNELNILADALKLYGSNDLLKQVNLEMKEREYHRKRHEEWLNRQPQIYCC